MNEYWLMPASLAAAAVVGLILGLWGCLRLTNRKLKSAVGQRDYFWKQRDGVSRALDKTERDYERCAYEKENYRIDNDIMQSEMVNCRRPWKFLVSDSYAEVYRPGQCQCHIVAKRFPYNLNDPDDREFARNEAEELCDKLNER